MALRQSNLISSYRLHFKDKEFILACIFSIALLAIAMIADFLSGMYAATSASNPVTDLVLDHLPVFDVDTILVYGPVVLWLFVWVLMVMKPRRLPFTFKSVGLFLLVRSVFVILTHLAPSPDHIVITSSNLISDFSQGGDLFFSGHTGLPFLLALIFWDNVRLRTLFILTSLFFGAIVLMAHVHYSIDVLGAFFITYAICHLAQGIFKKDRKMFNM